jgi:predicted transcriptional regulator
VFKSVTLKIPAKLQMRVSRAARQQGQRPRRWMLEAIEHEVERRERFLAYVKQAQHACAGASAEEADARRSLRFWLWQLSSGGKAGRAVARRTR